MTTYEETLKKIQNGEFGENSTEKSDYPQYEDATVQIQECLLVNLDSPQVEHWIIDWQNKNNVDAPIIAFKLKVNINGEVIDTVEADNLTTQKGKTKYYKTFENKNGEVVPASLLYEVTRKCKDFSTEQESKFEDPFKLNLEVYRNMKFNIKAKKTSRGIKLLTELQAKKDKEYVDSLKESTEIKTDEVKSVNTDDLPF
jgi:hypothetical protein